MLRSCLSVVLQLLLSCTVVLFFAYLSAISLSAWWLSHAESALGHSLRFPYLTEYVAKRFDKADKFFEVPLSEDLSLAVSALLPYCQCFQHIDMRHSLLISYLTPECKLQSHADLGLLGSHTCGSTAIAGPESPLSPQPSPAHQTWQSAKVAPSRHGVCPAEHSSV